MTEESDLFCMFFSASPIIIECFRLQAEVAAGRKKKFLRWYCPIVQRV